MPKNVLKEKSIEIKNSGKGSIVVNIINPPGGNRKKPLKRK
ncbi:MAG TPA: hypothetical protein PLX69_24860 [Leptospiraceae bacterium]|nr:hypothetical protein [Leptospiraceae bacterium]